jgi:hypothetical protein
VYHESCSAAFGPFIQTYLDGGVNISNQECAALYQTSTCGQAFGPFIQSYIDAGVESTTNECRALYGKTCGWAFGDFIASIVAVNPTADNSCQTLYQQRCSAAFGPLIATYIDAADHLECQQLYGKTCGHVFGDFIAALLDAGPVQAENQCAALYQKTCGHVFGDFATAALAQWADEPGAPQHGAPNVLGAGDKDGTSEAEYVNVGECLADVRSAGSCAAGGGNAQDVHYCDNCWVGNTAETGEKHSYDQNKGAYLGAGTAYLCTALLGWYSYGVYDEDCGNNSAVSSKPGNQDTMLRGRIWNGGNHDHHLDAHAYF